MQALRQIDDVYEHKVTITIPESISSKKVEVIVIPLKNNGEIISTPQQQYNFSDLVGKLHWDGNAVTEQRRIRDEW